MKNLKIIKINLLIILLAFSAGLIFLGCGFFGRLPSRVLINGIDVGGKTRKQAVQLVRGGIEEELKARSLTVYGKRDKYVFTYPEINYKDDLQNLVKTVKKGGSYTASVSYYLNGLTEAADLICDNESTPATEPYAKFNESGAPFTYYEGADGCKADKVRLLSDVRASLAGNFEDVRLKVDTVKRQKTLNDVKNDTRRLSAFVTYFDGGNAARSDNIRLAADLINGTVLRGGETFSFNEQVGERTAERGFKSAKIIEKGEFVEGIGGGVCQVSTTLYNAALLCGLQICEYHPHSLAVSYVPPSFDAMVSGNYFDLKFKNLSAVPVYIRARTGSNYVAFEIYGRSDGNVYSYTSQVTGTIPAPEEVTDDSSLIKEGKDGTVSEGYLTVTRGGVILKKTLIRRDKYAPVKRVVLSTDNAEEVEENETARNEN